MSLAKVLRVSRRLISCPGARGKLSLFLTVPREISNNGSHALELLDGPSSIITGAS